MKVEKKTVVVIDGYKVKKETTLENFTIFSRKEYEQEMILYFVKDEKVVKTITIKIDCMESTLKGAVYPPPSYKKDKPPDVSKPLYGQLHRKWESQ